MWRIVLGACICVVLALAGCGVEWFPEASNQLEPTPNAFTFTPVLCQTPSTLVQSADVEVTGVTSQATVKIDKGEYSLDKGSSWLSAASFVTPTDQKLTVRVRHTTAAVPASSADSEVVVSTLTIGNTSGIFYSTSNVGQTVCR